MHTHESAEDLDDAPASMLDDAVRLALLEQVPEQVLVVDDQYRIVYVNQTILSELGYRAEDIVGTSVLEFIHPDDLDYAARSMDNRRHHPGETGVTIQLRGRDASGAWRAADVVGRRVDVDGAPPLTVVSMRPVDNTPALGSDPERLRSLIDRTADVILLLDPDGQVLFANMTVTRRLGHDSDVIVSRTWTDLVHPEDREEARSRFEELVNGDRREAEWRMRLIDRYGNELIYALRLVDQHDDPLIAGIIVTATEVTTLVKMEEKLRRQNERLAYEATHDHATGLVNRAEFRRLVDAAIVGGNDDVVVLFCDLDGFKTINDDFGHTAGDRVLQVIAGRLSAAVRSGDVAGRWGGDEFTVLCRGSISPLEADQLRDRLRALIGDPIDLEGTLVSVGVSVGIARLAARTVDGDTLVDQADQAMYIDKRSRS